MIGWLQSDHQLLKYCVDNVSGLPICWKMGATIVAQLLQSLSKVDIFLHLYTGIGTACDIFVFFLLNQIVPGSWYFAIVLVNCIIEISNSINPLSPISKVMKTKTGLVG